MFDGLDISRTSTYTRHLNKYNVISLCLNSLSDRGTTYEDYINVTKNAIRHDLVKCYPERKDEEFDSISEMLAATEDELIFIIDERDYIFSHELYPEHYNDFLEFLRNLLKDKPYVALAYMTGVLPSKKYSTGSALNMFREYTMLNDPSFNKFFGFTETEVEMPCQRQTTLTIGEVRDDIIKMVNDMPVMLSIAEECSAGQKTIANREEILVRHSDEVLIATWSKKRCRGILPPQHPQVGLNYDTVKKEHQYIIEEL